MTIISAIENGEGEDRERRKLKYRDFSEMPADALKAFCDELNKVKPRARRAAAWKGLKGEK